MPRQLVNVAVEKDSYTKLCEIRDKAPVYKSVRTMVNELIVEFLNEQRAREDVS